MLCDPPLKKASPFTAYLIEDALGLKTFIYEDLIALKKLRARLTKCIASRRVRRALSTVELTPDFLPLIGKKGAEARMRNLSPAKRSQPARRAAKARWRAERTAAA
jgi:hypothetical protein